MSYNGIRFPSEDAAYSASCIHHYTAEEASGTIYDQATSCDLDYQYGTPQYQQSGVNGYAVGNTASTGGGCVCNLNITSEESTIKGDASWDAWTYEMWIYITGFVNPYNRSAYIKETRVGGIFNTGILRLWHYDVAPDTTCGIAFETTEADTENGVTYSADDVMSLNTWNHVAWAWSAANGYMRIYLNNVRIVNVSKAWSYFVGSDSLHLALMGSTATATESHAAGSRYDEYAIWGVELTDFSEVLSGRRTSGIGRGIGRGIIFNKDDTCGLIQKPTLREVIEIGRYQR